MTSSVARYLVSRYQSLFIRLFFPELKSIRDAEARISALNTIARCADRNTALTFAVMILSILLGIIASGVLAVRLGVSSFWIITTLRVTGGLVAFAFWGTWTLRRQRRWFLHCLCAGRALDKDDEIIILELSHPSIPS